MILLLLLPGQFLLLGLMVEAHGEHGDVDLSVVELHVVLLVPLGREGSGEDGGVSVSLPFRAPLRVSPVTPSDYLTFFLRLCPGTASVTV